MRTNIEIDDALMAQVMASYGVKTKREAVTLAMQEALRLRNQERIMELWGIGWEGDLEEMRLDEPRDCAA